MLLILQILEIWPIVFSSAYSLRKQPSQAHSQSVTEPCLFPKPFTKKLDIFCQYDYHKIPYMCDPTGALSRTEVEMLDDTVKSLNLTSCFCASTCDPLSSSYQLGIVVIPNVTLHDLEFCDKTVDSIISPSLPISAYQYGVLLNQYWSDQCNVDLMLLYIRIWVSNKVIRPFIVPIYANSLQRLQRFSRPIVTSNREPVLSVLQRALKHNKKIIESEHRETNSTVPNWAKWTTFGMVSFVCLAFYIANCVTNKMGKTQQKSKTSVASTRKSSDRFRAGFGGGMIMNQTQQKKSVMMFRTFSKTPRNNINRL
ncbi:unnamed protein product [Auanema sp. JU1783]|nr:unnamed protein product [Auanema sp. JU1783]